MLDRKISEYQSIFDVTNEYFYTGYLGSKGEDGKRVAFDLATGLRHRMSLNSLCTLVQPIWHSKFRFVSLRELKRNITQIDSTDS